MSAMIKRSLTLYFRNRAGVFFSMLGAFISFLLYIIFLKKGIRADWSQAPHADQLLDMWQIAGTLAITGMTTTLQNLQQMARDRETGVHDDLLLTDAGPLALHSAYMISAAIIGIIMQLVMLAVMASWFALTDHATLPWAQLPAVVGIMVLNATLATTVNTVFVERIHSLSVFGSVSTIIGTAAGFLVGSYFPVGALPAGAQWLVKLTPGAYIASLFRQTLMGDTLRSAFNGQPTVLRSFQKLMGIRLNWSGLLTPAETYGIVGGVLIVTGLLALLPAWQAARQRRALTNA